MWLITDRVALDGVAICSLAAGSGYEVFLDSLRSAPGVWVVQPFLQTSAGQPLLYGLEFNVGFKRGVTRDEIDALLSGAGVVLDRQIAHLDNTFALRNTPNSHRTTLELANWFNDLPEVRYALPDFIYPWREFSYQPDDRFIGLQYHLQRVIGELGQQSVWDFHGLLDGDDTVIVALLDDGFTTHADMDAYRLLPGIDFAGVGNSQNPPIDYDPSPGPMTAHGMACGGLIVASHWAGPRDSLWDSISGVAGVSPTSFLLPVKMRGDKGEFNIPASRIADAYDWAAFGPFPADVISSSFGWDADFQDSTLEEKLEMIAFNGRGGKGCPLVFAAGNESPTGGKRLVYPASLWYCLSVGATDLNDSVWNYSCRGDGLDLVAPSGIPYLHGDVWTLDQMGENWYNPHYVDKWQIPWLCELDGASNNQNFNCRFGGTSAAAPLVAGAAALLLKRNPSLFAFDVYAILMATADTMLAVTVHRPDTTYGWGRLNMFKAMLSISHGDANNDGTVDAADLGAIVDYLFSAIEPFPSPLLADCDCSGTADGSDLQYFLDWMDLIGPPPVNPCFNQ